MRSIFALFLLSLCLVGCAGSQVQSCQKINGVERCDKDPTYPGHHYGRD